MAKPELEFLPVTAVGWTPVPGSACPGLDERILSSDGHTATRILRFAPGTDTIPNGVPVNDFWEEVYILTGTITDLRLRQTFTEGAYACRPPGMPHRPWRSTDGCTTFEVRYPDSRSP
jgi:hypothetical protein